MGRRLLLAAGVLLLPTVVMSGCGLLFSVWKTFDYPIGFPIPPAPPKASSQPTSTATSAPTSQAVEPGMYHFTAKIVDVSMVLDDHDGVFNTKRGPAVCTGRDSRCRIEMKIMRVQKPIWFLEPGHTTFFFVHSANVIFGEWPIGKTIDLRVEVYQASDGSISCGQPWLDEPKKKPTTKPVQHDEHQPTTASAPAEDRLLQPGTYTFRARVEGVWPVGGTDFPKVVDGVATVDGERWIFTGVDVRWGIRLAVQEIDQPLWFLRSGETVTFVVHSPAHTLGMPGGEAMGQVFPFSLVIDRGADGTWDFGPLAAPGSPFYKEIATSQPRSDR